MDKSASSLTLASGIYRKGVTPSGDFPEVLRIRYETLAANLHGVLAGVHSWLGAPPRPDIFDPMIKVLPDTLSESIENYEEIESFVTDPLMPFQPLRKYLD